MLRRESVGDSRVEVVNTRSWERTTNRQGKVCWVHHGERRAVWRVPDTERCEGVDEEGTCVL